MSIDEDLLGDEGLLLRRDEHRLLWNLATAGAQVRRAIELRAEFGVERLAGEQPRALLVATDAPPSLALRLVTRLSCETAPALAWHGVELPAWAGASRRAADRRGGRPASRDWPNLPRRVTGAAWRWRSSPRPARPSRPRPGGRRCTNSRPTCTRAQRGGRCSRRCCRHWTRSGCSRSPPRCSPGSRTPWTRPPSSAARVASCSPTRRRRWRWSSPTPVRWSSVREPLPAWRRARRPTRCNSPPASPRSRSACRTASVARAHCSGARAPPPTRRLLPRPDRGRRRRSAHDCS